MPKIYFLIAKNVVMHRTASVMDECKSPTYSEAAELTGRCAGACNVLRYGA